MAKKFDVDQNIVITNPTGLKGWLKKYSIVTIKTLDRKTRQLSIKFESKDYAGESKTVGLFLNTLSCSYKEVTPLNKLTKYQQVQVMKRRLRNE